MTDFDSQQYHAGICRDRGLCNRCSRGRRLYRIKGQHSRRVDQNLQCLRQVLSIHSELACALTVCCHPSGVALNDINLHTLQKDPRLDISLHVPSLQLKEHLKMSICV